MQFGRVTFDVNLFASCAVAGHARDAPLWDGKSVGEGRLHGRCGGAVNGPRLNPHDECSVVVAAHARSRRARTDVNGDAHLSREVPGLAGFVVLEDVLGDQDPVHFVGAVGETKGARSEIHRREWQVI